MRNKRHAAALFPPRTRQQRKICVAEVEHRRWACRSCVVHRAGPTLVGSREARRAARSRHVLALQNAHAGRTNIATGRRRTFASRHGRTDMPETKQASKRKRTKEAVPVL